MATGSRQSVLKAALTLLIVSLSSALPTGRRNGRAGDFDNIVNRDLLLSTDKKEMPDEDSIRQLTDLVEQLTAKRSRSDSAGAGASLQLISHSRTQDQRRAAFEDEDPLHIHLSNELPQSSREQNERRTVGDSVKRKLLLPSAIKRYNVVRGIAHNLVGGVSRDQRQLQKVNRPSRQDFMYAIGAAERPSHDDAPSFLDFQYGSQGWQSTDSNDSDEEDDYYRPWVECDENDPECGKTQ